MPTKKVVGKNDFVWVRSIYGKGPDAKQRYEHIPDGGMNAMVKSWQSKQPEKDKSLASPSTLLTCPRVAWLLNKGAQPTNEMTWAVKQRLLLGRLAEGIFAQQLKDEGMLLKWWEDEPGMEVEKFVSGEGINRFAGVPDYLVMLGKDQGNVIAISDAKTSRSDSFGYVGFDESEIFSDWGWFKYRIQLTAYYMLCHDNKLWFEKRGLPTPTHCHLFSYALDDGVVRREVLWTPTAEDMQLVKDMAIRYNMAVASPEMPKCTCHESFDNFATKFCQFGVVEQGKKIAESCCSDDLINLVKE